MVLTSTYGFIHYIVHISPGGIEMNAAAAG